MKRQGEAFVGIDTAKARNAVAVAEGDRNGEVRYLGEFDYMPLCCTGRRFGRTEPYPCAG